jgi:hypothetical protein
MTGALIAKLSDAEVEAAETQVRLEHAPQRADQFRDSAAALSRDCDQIIRLLVAMNPDRSKGLRASDRA